MILGDGTVCGERYYTVKPMYWTQYGDNVHWDEMITWCVRAFGPTPKDGVWTPNSRWYANNTRLWFKNEADRTMFILRFS